MNRKRPILSLPYSPLEKGLETLSLILICLMWMYLSMSYSSLHGQIPTHFGFSGQADAWGEKSALFVLPAIGALLYVLFTVLARYPHLFNYPKEVTEANAPFLYRKSREMLAWLKMEELALFSYIEWNTIALVRSHSNGENMAFLPFAFVVIFGTIGIHTFSMLRHK